MPSRRRAPGAKAARSRTATVGDAVGWLARIAPPHRAADWDNVGLIVGNPDAACRTLLVTGDLTPDVLDEAIRSRAGLIVSYHPPIFRQIKRLVADGRRSAEGLAAEAMAHGIAVYSPHTAWDAAPGGPNDALAALCGLRALQPMHAVPASSATECKVVVFVPAAAVDRVAETVFAAGAGRIGEYTHCSFRLAGQGTFFGTDAASPVVGRRGRLERVDEVRLEAVAPLSRLPEVVAAIRRTHPYEEPAFDIYPLTARPAVDAGQGRVGAWPASRRLGDLASDLRRRLRAVQVAIVGAPTLRLRRGLVCVGAAGSLPFDAPGGAGPGDVVVTGEIRHHDALRYLRCGAAAIALGHWASERPGVDALAARLSRAAAAAHVVAAVRRSRADRDPFTGV